MVALLACLRLVTLICDFIALEGDGLGVGVATSSCGARDKVLVFSLRKCLCNLEYKV